MAENGEDRRGLSPGTDRALRVAIVSLMVLAVGGAVWWRALAVRLRQGVRLYRDYEYEKAEETLAPLLRNPLSRLGLRRPARWTLLLCKAHLAAEPATVEGYKAALLRFADARAAGAPPEEVDEYVASYAAELRNLEAREKAEPANEDSP